MKKRVLLVDDEPEICFLLRNLLNRQGMDCRIANSLKEARTAVSQDRYDAVFLDVHLSDGLGYELIGDLRKSPNPVLCIAISAVDAERVNAERAGADRFISKPFSQADILSALSPISYSPNTDQ